MYWATKREGTQEELLRGCYRRSLELAVENGCRSVGFSALSTGVYGYPSGEAAEAAAGEVKLFLEGESGGEVERVVFCCFERKDVLAYEESLPYASPVSLPYPSLSSSLLYYPPINQSTKLTHPPPSNRKFFPPTPHDLSPQPPSSPSRSDDLIASMPDPPTANPSRDDEPEAKKQKLDPDDALDQDWQQVEKPDADALAASKGDMSEEGELVKASATEEQSARGLHTAEGGGDPPPSGLLRDW